MPVFILYFIYTYFIIIYFLGDAVEAYATAALRVQYPGRYRPENNKECRQTKSAV